MFGDGGKRNVEWLGEFLDSGFALGETRENGAAGGVGEGTERGVERGRRIVNHVVYYCTATGFCQAVFFGLSGMLECAWQLQKNNSSAAEAASNELTDLCRT